MWWWWWCWWVVRIWGMNGDEMGNGCEWMDRWARSRAFRAPGLSLWAGGTGRRTGCTPAKKGRSPPRVRFPLESVKAAGQKASRDLSTLRLFFHLGPLDPVATHFSPPLRCFFISNTHTYTSTVQRVSGPFFRFPQLQGAGAQRSNWGEGRSGF